MAEIVIDAFDALPAYPENGLLSARVTHGFRVINPGRGRIENAQVELTTTSKISVLFPDRIDS